MLNLKIVNSPITKSVNFKLKNIVNNYTDFLGFSDIVTSNSIPIEYIELPELTSQKNLEILDLSWSLSSNNLNNIANVDKVFFAEGREFLLPYKKVLFTNVSLNNEPLFYQHKIDTTSTVVSASVYSVSNFDSNQETGFKFDKANGAIYTNYKNYFDKKNGFYKLYYVNFTLQSGESKQELLNPEPIIKELSFLDIEIDETKSNYGNIKDGITRYVVSPNYGQLGFSFNIQSNRNVIEDICSEDTVYETKGFYIMFLESNIIKVNKPENVYLDKPWHVRINNSEVFSTSHLYKIPEYEKQAFNPIYGVTWHINKDCDFVNSSVLKLSSSNIVYNKEYNLFFTLFEYDSNGSLLKTYSTDENLINNGANQFDSFSLDELNGFIYSESLFNQENIYRANYYLELTDYVYNKFDFNPLNNKIIKNNKVVIYIEPDRYSITDMQLINEQSAINHLVVNEDDVIIAASDSYHLGSNYFDFVSSYDNQKIRLAEIKIREDYSYDDIFNFSLIEQDFTSKGNYEDLIKRNHNVLQSKLGYGIEGQYIQRINQIIVKAPYTLYKEHNGDFSESELYYNIANYLGYNRNLVLIKDYKKSKLKLTSVISNEHQISVSWEGPGTYKLWRRYDDTLSNKAFLQEIPQTSRPPEDTLTFTINYNNSNYSIAYYSVTIEDDKLESNLLGVEII